MAHSRHGVNTSEEGSRWSYAAWVERYNTRNENNNRHIFAVTLLRHFMKLSAGIVAVCYHLHLRLFVATHSPPSFSHQQRRRRPLPPPPGGGSLASSFCCVVAHLAHHHQHNGAWWWCSLSCCCFVDDVVPLAYSSY